MTIHILIIFKKKHCIISKKKWVEGTKVAADDYLAMGKPRREHGTEVAAELFSCFRFLLALFQPGHLHLPLPELFISSWKQ